MSYEAPRREKLEKIAALGVDPWGSRLDDRDLIGDLRARVSEVRFQKEDGTVIELPSFDGPEEVDYRQWKADNGPGQEIGPQVRAAGRIMLSRDTGKLLFINIQDWTGRIQLFVGRRQVGDENWELASYFDLGDLIAVDGRLGRTNTGELTIFVSDSQ